MDNNFFNVALLKVLNSIDIFNFGNILKNVSILIIIL